jgi:Sugar (and other) transporter
VHVFLYVQLLTSFPSFSLFTAIWATFGYTYYSTVIVLTEIFAFEDVSRQKGGGNITGTYSFDFGAVLMSALSEVAGTTIGFLFVDRFGRVPCQVIPHAAGGVLICLACILASSDTEPSTSMRRLLIFVAFLARMFFMCGSSVAWISTAEILSSQVRATGHSSANAINKLSGALSPFLVLTTTKSRYPTIGVVLLLVSLVTAACAGMLPETKGKTMGTHSTTTVLSAEQEGEEGLEDDEAEELSPADHRGTWT